MLSKLKTLLILAILSSSMHYFEPFKILAQLCSSMPWTIQMEKLSKPGTETSIAAGQKICLKNLKNPSELELINGISGKTAATIYKKLTDIRNNPNLTKEEAIIILARIPRIGNKIASNLLADFEFQSK